MVSQKYFLRLSYAFSLFLFRQYEEGKKRRKPNYSSVDLSEVEWEDRDDVVSNLISSLVRRTLRFTLLCLEPVKEAHQGNTWPSEGCRDHGPLYAFGVL